MSQLLKRRLSMSFIAIGRGLVKIVVGIAKREPGEIAKGVGGVALGTAGEAIKWAINEEAGEAVSQKGEEVVED
ncbi:MAG: hypothetical protein ACO1TE_19595 [Prosthecobacter sp.]